MGTQQGRKWDLTDCGHLSSEGSSYNITSWPRGDHNDANDYSASGECTESPSTCLAEMLACAADMGEGTYSFYWYDPYGRNIFNYSTYAIGYACSWIGRFGEVNLPLEIYKPGLYYCYMIYPGGSTYKYFDIYDQTSAKYLHKQGNNGSGNSWGAAKSTWAGAQSALSAGNNLYVGEGDYSSENGFTFSKSMNINPVKATWGGYPDTSSSYSATSGSSGAELDADVGNPIEMNGTIDRWAYLCMGNSSNTVKLKIYRYGNPGTMYASTSTLIYTSDSHTESSWGWKTYILSPPVSVERGDIIALQSSEVNMNIGLRSISSPPSGYLTAAASVSGDPGNTTIGSICYENYAIMVRAWNSETQFEIGLPRY
jgi:hypothetical protein